MKTSDTPSVGMCRAPNYLDATSRIEALVMFDPEVTTDIQSFLLELKSVPLGNLIGSIRPGYRYGYIGVKDRMMYPLNARCNRVDRRATLTHCAWSLASRIGKAHLLSRNAHWICVLPVRGGRWQYHFATAPTLSVTYARSALE
jgi:hypothetical protein